MGTPPKQEEAKLLAVRQGRLDASLPHQGLPQALLTLFQRQAQPAPVTLYDLTQPF